MFMCGNKDSCPSYILQGSFELKIQVIWDVILYQLVITSYSFSNECSFYIFPVKQSKKSGLLDA